MIFQSYSKISKELFFCVRFGNVLDSSSVFKEQIKTGDGITLADPEDFYDYPMKLLNEICRHLF